MWISGASSARDKDSLTKCFREIMVFLKSSGHGMDGKGDNNDENIYCVARLYALSATCLD